jgi:hypothetical protein
MLHMFERAIAFVVFVGSGLWVFTVFTSPSLIAQTGGFQATFWRPLVWAVLIALVFAVVLWRRQWERLLLVTLALVVVGLVMYIANPVAFAAVSAVVIPSAWWVSGFTLAEAVFLLLSLVFLFKPRRPRWGRKSQKGGEVSAA